MLHYRLTISSRQIVTQTSGKLDIGAGGAADTENNLQIRTEGGTYYIETIGNVTTLFPTQLRITARPQG